MKTLLSNCLHNLKHFQQFLPTQLAWFVRLSHHVDHTDVVSSYGQLMEVKADIIEPTQL